MTAAQIQNIGRIDRLMTLSDGRRLSFAEFGDLDGKPLLYMHGGACSRLDLLPLNDLLKNQGVRIVAPDRPGVGMSDRKIGRSLLDWGADASELVSALGLNRFAVLGWSLGGPYAMVCAHVMPERVVRIGTVGGATPMDRPGALAELGSALDRHIFTWTGLPKDALFSLMNACRIMPPSLMKYFLLLQLDSKDDRQIVREMTADDATRMLVEGSRQGPAGIFDDYYAVGKPWGFDLGALKSELIVWQGSEDTMCPMTYANFLNENVPRSKLVIVSQRGHFLMFKQMQEILDTLLA